MVIEYAKDRDAAVVESIKTDSVEPFKAFIAKYQRQGVFPRCFYLPNDDVLEISIRQMALHCTNIDPMTKGLAVDWLTKNGHHLDCTADYGKEK